MQEILSVTTFVRKCASESITYLMSYLKAAGYVCEGTEGHIEPKLKRQRDTAGQPEQSDRDSPASVARQPDDK